MVIFIGQLIFIWYITICSPIHINFPVFVFFKLALNIHVQFFGHLLYFFWVNPWEWNGKGPCLTLNMAELYQRVVSFYTLSSTCAFQLYHILANSWDGHVLES